MQALILVGGEGTRLRPLTLDTPKPVVTLVDRPFMAYMLEWLAGHGVDDVVLSCGFRADKVRAVLGDGSGYGVRIRYREEPRPLGTGGALKFCEDLLDERFLMLNGDVLTDLDLTAQIAQHEATGATGTLALVPVADPSNYGLVRLDAGNRVLEFIEKPQHDVGVNTISAGAYVLERSVLALLEPGAKASIERDVFPRLVGHGLHGRVDDGYWLDIGTPERYLQGSFDILTGAVRTRVRAEGGILLGKGSAVEGEVRAPAVVGSAARIGRDAVVERAVVLEGAVVGARAVVRECIVCPGASVDQGERVRPGTIVG
jgi:mannose-1-phosphate guanylyltransferase